MSIQQRTVLLVEGMSCNHCVHSVDKALRDLAGVRAVDVKLEDGRVTVEHEAAEPSVGAMIEAVRDAGYEASVAA